LDGNEILQPVETEYAPKPGALDGTVSKERGTRVILRDFYHRHVPTMDDFNRQLAQRFGIQTDNWSIELVDNLQAEGTPGASTVVGLFSIDLMPGTRVDLTPTADGVIAGRVFGSDGKSLQDYSAGFTVDGKGYPISGWIAYAKESYKDDLMAGVRVYCRGKIAAQTSVFNQRAGFTGEHDVRSYLVGELSCDWLDEEEDLIQTDRRDILWSHELGQEFERWGQGLVKKIGALSRNPMREKAWDVFRRVTNFEEQVKKEFSLPDQKDIRNRAMQIGRLFGGAARPDELADPERAGDIAQLSLMLAPVIELDEKLREAADKDNSLGTLTALLRVARVAELASFGRIADDRVRVIERVQALKDDGISLEPVFQELIEKAPWLINPQWSPLTANQAFSTLKREFVKFYKSRTGEEIVLDDFSPGNKRADFVMSNQDSVVQIIEIKRPGHKLDNEEFKRISTYHDLMDEFLKKPGNEEFRRVLSDFHITLVCDDLGLDSVSRKAFDGLVARGKLTHVTWEVFLLRTRRMHEDFLREAERQRKNANKTIQD
jgi:hypothetical protein